MLHSSCPRKQFTHSIAADFKEKKKKETVKGEKKPVPLQNIQFPSSSNSPNEKNVLVWCPSNSRGFAEDFGECIYSFANCKNRFILQPCAE